jgi:hypothetical protein
LFNGVVFNGDSPWHVYEYGRTAKGDWAKNPTTEGYETFEDWYYVEVYECTEWLLKTLTMARAYAGICPKIIMSKSLTNKIKAGQENFCPPLYTYEMSTYSLSK